MEIQQLRHLQAAANSQSYAQAAKKCFTSRQNIAHSVKALEGEVGTPLFERKGNRMVLTEEGRQVAYVVDEVLERVDRLGSMFQDGLAARSMLNLAVSTNFFAGMPLAVDELLLGKVKQLQILRTRLRGMLSPCLLERGRRRNHHVHGKRIL